MFTPSLQDVQNLRNVTGLVSPTARVYFRQQPSLLWWVCRCQRGRVSGTSRGYQTPQDGGEGRAQEDFQGTQVLTHLISCLDSG